MIISVDVETGFIVDHNRTANITLGYEPDELERMRVFDLYHPSDRSKAKSILRRFRNVGSVVDARVKFVVKGGGSIDVSVNMTAIRDSSGKITRSISTIRDESERVEAEKVLGFARQLDSENRELVRLNEMRSEFLSRVSHELRTPLTALLAFASILSKDRTGTLTPKQAEQLGYIRNNGWKLEGLIEDLLDVARAEAGSFDIDTSEIDLTGVIKSAVDEAHSIFELKNQRLSLDLPTESAWITGDDKRISQVISNLLTNASKYSLPATNTTVRLSRENRRMCLTIIDQGIGISESDMPKLFSPFFRADNELTRREAGTGLGLVIIKSIVELHGGTITVDSTEGTGSTFRVLLPLSVEGLATAAGSITDHLAS